MDRVIEQMAKARGDVERRMRRRIPEIIEECRRFAYLGKEFTFGYDKELDRNVSRILIALSDDILEDIESRARTVIKEAEDEDDTDAILAYIKRGIDGTDLTERIDGHCSALRYFLEGWIAIGLAESISAQSLLADIFAYMDNPYASPLWQSAFGKGYSSGAIRSQGYSFGKGNQRNVLKALSLAEETAINTAFQYGTIQKYSRDGAIGYIIHRGSSYDCPYCDSNCGFVIPLNDIRLPQHPRCVCYSTPVYRTDEPESRTRIQLTDELKAYRKELQREAIEKYRGNIVYNQRNITIQKEGIKEFLNQPHKNYFTKNEAVRYLPELIQSSRYLGINTSYKKPGLRNSHIYETEIDGEKSWLIIREYDNGDVLFHSISDNPKIAQELK